MRRISLISLMLSLVLAFSCVALADEIVVLTPEEAYNQHVDDDGIITWTGTNTEGLYDNIPWIDRTDYSLDVDGTTNKQSALITLRAQAQIPCYLEMRLTGNQGQTFVQSFGPNANATAYTGYHYMLDFDNEIGGYVDDNWNWLGHGRNAEILPGDGVYLFGCDSFKVEVYANDHFKYGVKASALTGAGVLPLIMRTSSDNLSWGSDITFDETVEEEVTLADNVAPLTTLTTFHAFKVPVKNVMHGQYTGNVHFLATTI